MVGEHSKNPKLLQSLWQGGSPLTCLGPREAVDCSTEGRKLGPGVEFGLGVAPISDLDVSAIWR